MEQSGDPLADLANEHWSAGHVTTLSEQVDGETWVAAVDAGFLSVADNRVSILSERAEMSHEIDLEKARHEIERAKAAGENDDEAVVAARRAEARIRAVERAR